MSELQAVRPLLFSIARRMVGNAADAEDLTQEALLRYCTTPPAELRSLKSLLATIIRRLSINHLRSARRTLEHPFGILPATVETGPAQARFSALTGGWLELGGLAVQTLLERLTPQERAALVLHDLFAFDHEEIAGMLCLSEANCWQLLHRARERLERPETRFTPSRAARDRLEALFLEACRNDDPAGLLQVLIHDSRAATLPQATTPLVGRQKLLEQVVEMLRGDGSRLITLTGPPGVGKTRLAMAVAGALVNDFEQGVFFTPLAPVGEAGLLSSLLGLAPGIRSRNHADSDREVTDLETWLQDRAILLVLDNFEHILPAARLLGRLLEAAPRVKMLVTSRAALRLKDEHVLPVPPLAGPPVGRTMGKAVSLERLQHFASVQLFVDRALSVREDFTLTEKSAGEVAALCHALDNLPLTIELAASQISRFTPAEMMGRLDDRLSLLNPDRAKRTSRQRTLRGTLEWSFALLEVQEQAVLMRLGVFAGGCTREAIAAVLGEAISPAQLEAALSSLEQKSLIQRRLAEELPERFSLLETIRVYALEKLMASGQWELSRNAHARYFLELAATARKASLESRQAYWLSLLAEEQPNLRAALGLAIARSDAELAQRLSGTLWWFWYFSDSILEGTRWLEAALALPGSTPLDIRAEALHGLAVLLNRSASPERAIALFEECLALQRQIGDRPAIARSLHNLTLVERDSGNPERAAVLFEEELALCQTLDDKRGLAFALCYGAMLARDRGDLAGAELMIREAIPLSIRGGAQGNVAMLLALQGNIRLLQGDLTRATRLLRESLMLHRALGHQSGIALSLLGLGLVATARGRPEAAAVRLRRALAISHKRQIFITAVECLEALAGVFLMQQRSIQAARVAGAAAGLRQDRRRPVPPIDRSQLEQMITSARAALGDVAFDAAWSEGFGMSLDEAVRHAWQVAG